MLICIQFTGKIAVESKQIWAEYAKDHKNLAFHWQLFLFGFFLKPILFLSLYFLFMGSFYVLEWDKHGLLTSLVSIHGSL